MNRFTDDKPLSIAFDSEIPREGPEVFILRLKANQLFSFTLLSDKHTGVWAHWQGKKSGPHFKEEDRCPGCISRQPKRWKAYVHAFCHELGQEVFVELTPHSAQSLENQIGKGVNYRGNRFQAKRGKADNGRLTITMLQAISSPAALPPAKDPMPSIMALWGIFADKKTGQLDLAERFRMNGKATHDVCL